jgi:c-di-GMP-binding flagellar brake protein YcgR
MAAAPTTGPVIPVGTHVSLHLPHIGSLPARVDAHEPGVLVVVLAVKDNRVFRLDGADTTVETVTGRGIQRFSGTLQLSAGGSGETLRILLQGEAERIQRREWARIDAVVPVSVRGIDQDLGGDTHTLNVSGGGILITDPWQLPIGTDVRVELEVEPGAPPVRALGRVVREPAPDRRGVRIDDISRADEERLVRFVRDRERAALRMGGRPR